MAGGLFSQRDRSRKVRYSPFSDSLDSKHYSSRSASSWTTPVFVKIPCLADRHLRLFLPIPPRLFYHFERYGRRRGLALLWITLFAFAWFAYALITRFVSSRSWPRPSFGDPPTLVYAQEDLQQIWQWEIASGHYQSTRPIPLKIGLGSPPSNPGVPRSSKPITGSLPHRFRPPSARIDAVEYAIGAGPERVYLDIQSQPPNLGYPPRPIPGSIADLDIVMDNCDFSKGKYVRDCLEVLRIGAGLDSGKRIRRGNLDRWKYIYREEGTAEQTRFRGNMPGEHLQTSSQRRIDKDRAPPGFVFRDNTALEAPLQFSPVMPYRTQDQLREPCDPDYPRQFHMFWTGPFTDKPYLALLSFLYTQNTGLHIPHDSLNAPNVCRPKFWVWINPGPAAAVPNPNALHDMYDSLAANPWSAPFLHPRFQDVLEFKMWNTTEQLDGIDEIRSEWRKQPALFNSGGHKYSVKKADKQEVSRSMAQDKENASKGQETKAADPSPTQAGKPSQNNIYNKVGSSSASDYDRLSVILSDMARFILCHRFGGTYLDADTLLLRDWEELWGWKGAFAYRWSRLEKYNTAVLRMGKGSALGSFLFRTALRNELDFHPMTVSRYMKDSYLEPLLLRLPDALFDSAWLNTENYQRDRPPFPYFQAFSDLFRSSDTTNAGPQALGFDGFFKGAYSYHFHNSWWTPFDPSRNWPDLGPRFAKGEAALKLKMNVTRSVSDLGSEHNYGEEDVLSDQRDLEWSTVLKRTFEGYIRGERPNLYGEWLAW